MERILKMVNHELTDAQIDDLGDVELVALPESLQSSLRQCYANIDNLRQLAYDIKNFCMDNNIYTTLSPAGSPAFNAIFSHFCRQYGITQKFSHSIRKFVETVNPDGTVSKTNIFKHICFIDVV